MTKTINTSILTLFGLFIGISMASGQSYFFGTPVIKNFRTEEFNGGIQSWAFAQDDREVIYIANNFGLIEYDGTSWNDYPVKNGTKVRALHISEDNRIYVGCQADFGFFTENEKGQLQYTSLADSLEQKHRNFDEVWRIFQLDDGIAFLTFKDIYIYKPGKAIQVIEPKYAIEFSFLVNKTIYTQVWGQGLSVLRNEQLELLPGGAFYNDKQIVSILPFDKDHLMIFTHETGIFLYNGSASIPFPSKGLNGDKESIINQAIMLHDGNFAIGTQDKGLIVMARDGQKLMVISRENGLSDRTIHSLYQDAHDNLWLGLNNGVSVIELSSPFSLIDGKMGLAGTGYAAIRVDNTLYLGTNNGLFWSKMNGKTLHFEQIPSSSGQIYHLNKINDKILIGHHNGPYMLKNNSLVSIGTEKGIWEFVSHPIKRDHILMGSYTGLSLYIDKGSDLVFSHKYEGFSESSRVMEFDNNHKLWMAHGYKGIFSFDFDSELSKIEKVDFYNSKNGFPSDQLINMERIRNELIFPASFGIFRFNSQKNNFRLDENLSAIFYPREHLVEMEEDILGNIYFISDLRIGKLSFDKFGVSNLDQSVFNKIQDMLNDDLSYIHILDAGNVLFGAKDGFIHYDASKQKVLKNYHTHITKVFNITSETDSLIVSGSKIASSQKVSLPYSLNSLRFVYSSSFYESPEKTEYAYFLENFDQGYSDWNLKTEKEYTNLSEGKYTFKVKARNIYGEESIAQSFSFSIQPPFYRSTYAYVFYFLSGLLVIGLTINFVDKRYQKERKLFLLKQQRELNQKDSEIRNITDKSEQEIMQLKTDKLQTEVDHMNRELTNSTIHLINKNELLGSVKGNLEEIIKRGERSGHTEELRRIIKNIDQNINSDGDWKQFELHFNHVHGDFTHRLLERFPGLTPQEIKLSAYLRLNLNTKEIAQLLNISVRGVEISRYRLRKKLNLDRNDNLTDFILKF